MAGEGQLMGRGEDAEPRCAVGARGRQEEGRLRQVHLPGDRLHLAIGQAGGVENHRQRIAAEDAIGEDVDLDEAVLPHQGNMEKSSAFSVMNSRSAGVPSRVWRIARWMAGTISPGSVTRSPWPPKARAMSA